MVISSPMRMTRVAATHTWSRPYTANRKSTIFADGERVQWLINMPNSGVRSTLPFSVGCRIAWMRSPGRYVRAANTPFPCNSDTCTYHRGNHCCLHVASATAHTIHTKNREVILRQPARPNSRFRCQWARSMTFLYDVQASTHIYSPFPPPPQPQSLLS